MTRIQQVNNFFYLFTKSVRRGQQDTCLGTFFWFKIKLCSDIINFWMGFGLGSFRVRIDLYELKNIQIIYVFRNFIKQLIKTRRLTPARACGLSYS